MMAPMQATMPIAIHAFFGIEANAPKASAKMIRMPVPLKLFAFFRHEYFNLEKWVLAQWQYPINTLLEPWATQRF
jgi:hypothetical protein